MSINLKDKIIWVTGAGRGIGKATAIELAKEDAIIILSSRTGDEINIVSDKIKTKGGRSYAFVCDVSQSSSVESVYSKIKKNVGNVDILINNAGIFKLAPILETTLDNWNSVLDINLKGVFLTTKSVLPSMIERKAGHIVNISSVAGIEPYANSSTYCASKYGLMGFTAVTREEVREYGIKVTAILPGAVDTSIWNSLDFGFDRKKMLSPEDVSNSIVSALKTGKNAMPEDIILRPVTKKL